MKVAITSTGDHTDAKIDSRFGRCSYFVVYDTENGSTEFIPNPNLESIEGAGPASVQLVASKGVSKVVSGEFGSKVKSIFDQLKIQLIVVSDPSKKISDIIELLNQE
jgi:predicted Fe-Mo cluster-binding NifX family protein